MVSHEASERFLASGWLPDMEESSRIALLQVLQEHRAESGTTVLEQGKSNDRMAFLMEGTIEVSQLNRQNKPAVLYRIEAPSMFGLTSFFRPKPPEFTLRATSPIRFLTLDHAAHARLRRESPHAAEQLAVAAVGILADRIDALDHRIIEDLAKNPEDRPRQDEWAAFRARLFKDTPL